MKTKKKMLSLILAFSMVLSLFAGQALVKTESQAAEIINKIELGNRNDIKSSLGTDFGYTYPEAEINLKDSNETLYCLSISVDTGYMKTQSTKIAGVTGTGIVIGTGLDKEVYMEDLSETKQFQSMYFEIENGVTKEQFENFIKQVTFYTQNGVVQKVSVCVTAVKEPQAEYTDEWGNKKNVDLKFFNGHFYGYANGYFSWKQAYKLAKQAEFAGMTGYLLTLTSRAEDRFIHTMFEKNGIATKGWMGCTRATTSSDYDGVPPEGITDTYWNELAQFDTENLKNNVWRWVCGPEAHMGNLGAFGYQNDAYGWSGGSQPDGGFSVYDGWFANWSTLAEGHGEPNGGHPNGNTQEGYGYYGEAANGKWNDQPDSWGKGYYVEFGGYVDDEEKAQEDGTIVIVEKNSDESDVTEKPNSGPVGAKSLTGNPSIVPDNRSGKAGTVLTADVSEIGPAEAIPTLIYQWYTVNEDGTKTPITGATERTYTTKEEDKEKTFVVEASSGSSDYEGTRTSDELIPIQDVVTILNTSKRDHGKEVVKEGTIFSADITGVNPVGSRGTLTYQWFLVDDNDTKTPIDGATYKNYTLTSNDLDKKLVVEVTGNGKYYNTLASDPKDTTRTDAGVTIGDDPESDTLTIIVDPTIDGYVYTLEYANGELVPEDKMVVVNGDGDPLTPGEDGYYEEPAGGVIKFTELDPNETYVVKKKNKETGDEDRGGVVGPTIPDEQVKTEIDDKDTKDKDDDTLTIIIDPAGPKVVYAVEVKRDDKWEPIPVKKDENGNYIPDPSGDNPWSEGGEGIVIFAELPVDATYKVVAKDGDGNIKDITPDEIIGGSSEIKKPDEPETPDNPTPTPDDNTNPGTSTNPVTPANPTTTQAPTTDPNASGTQFTKEQEDAAAKFIKDHATDPSGKVITSITDLTRDIIAAGESDWKKLTAQEKAAVNAKLKASGSKYTYEQLLKMAKKYKIPGFKVIKFMKKNSKAKLKLIKCSGATIACTSTNKKVATVNKKGVISAKKPGRATLTFTAVKGKYTNRLVIDVRVKKKFKNAKELTNFKSKVIKTPTVLVAKKRLLKKSSRIDVYDLEKSSKVTFTPINKKILTINKKGKYTGKKKGSTLVRVNINQNKKTYLLYVYVTIY